MQPYFEDHGVGTVLFATTVGAFVAGEIRQAIRRRAEAESADRFSLIAVRLSLYAGFLAASLSASKLTDATIRGGVAVAIIGVAIAWTGLAIRWWAFVALGRYFTIKVMTSPDQPVITTGPYRFVRHPGYSGLVLILFGIGVLFGNWIGLAGIVVLPLVGLVYRIFVEERALTAALGGAYRTFASSRQRLIPHVW